MAGRQIIPVGHLDEEYEDRKAEDTICSAACLDRENEIKGIG